jgi:hypothetical protein
MASFYAMVMLVAPALRSLGAGIWTIDHPFKLMGVHLGTRTTVLGLEGGGVLVHAPGPLSDEQRAEIDAIGPVRAIVLPNRLHHLFAAAAAEAWPDAPVHAAGGLRGKRPDLRIDEELGETSPAAWADSLDLVAIEGVPEVEETAHFHRRSRTLVVTDLVFHIRESPSWYTRLFMRLNGAYGRLGCTRIFRRTIRDRVALRRSVDRLLALDFDRIVVAHGEVLETGGRDALAGAFSWLPG